MKCDFKIEPPYYIYKGKSKNYKWPCESNLEREIELIDGDILTKRDTDMFNMVTGIYKVGIHIPESDLFLETKKTTHMSFM